MESVTFMLSAVHLGPSYLFFCYRCGEVYARAIRRGSTFQSSRGTCSTCPPESTEWNWLPGSIWSDYDPSFNAALPLEAVRREFELHLNVVQTERELV